METSINVVRKLYINHNQAYIAQFGALRGFDLSQLKLVLI